MEQDFSSLLVHRAGNYFMKQLILSSTTVQRLRILERIQAKLKEACFDTYGVHPVQELLCLHITKQEEEIIRKELCGHICNLAVVFDYRRTSMGAMLLKN